jgi:predicted ribosome quality control (RQC) complex YloA/Tae2 family protein
MSLSGAIVQKVERVTREALVLTVRLPRETRWLLVMPGVIGAIERPPHQPADAFVQRLRKHLEGGRIVGLFKREDGYRVVVRRGDERFALIAGRTVTFAEGVSADGAALERASADGAALERASAEGASEESDAERDDARLSEAAQAAFAQHLARLDRERRQALISAVDGARKKLRRRLEAVDGDLAKIGRADDWQALATLLVTHAHLVRRGSSAVTLDDWSSGEAVAVTIPLDPSRTAKENAEALFHRARRLKRGRAVAEARRAESERALATLERLASDARAGEMAVLEARAKAAGIRVAAAAGKKRPEADERRPYTELTSGERVVYVGRGAKDNDELTTKVARPWDLWLHAKGWTGAHVIVPLSKNESCPAELLVDAAHLAAHFSDARGESVVEVQYTPRKYVRKPRGGAPGAVLVEREKVLVLRVEPARLSRLLSGR